MKPCETCKHFNMEEAEYCNVEAYVEDGNPCHQYTTSCNPERLYKILENADVVATEICERAESCSSCPLNFIKDGKSYCAINLDELWKMMIHLERKIKNETSN